MYDIKEVLKRMKTIAGVHSNIELAQILNVSYNTFNTWLKRKKFPQEILIEFSIRYECSLDYLLFNKNKKKENNNGLLSVDYYGRYEPLNISFKAKLILKKDKFINGAFYLIKKENIYFIAQAFFSFEDTKKVKLFIENESFDISFEFFRTLLMGLIIDIK